MQKQFFRPSVNPGPSPSYITFHTDFPILSLQSILPLPNILSHPLCHSTYCCGHVQLFSAFHAFYIFVTADCPSLSFSVLYQRLTLSWSVRQRCRDVKRNITHHRKPWIAKLVWKWETFMSLKWKGLDATLTKQKYGWFYVSKTYLFKMILPSMWRCDTLNIAHLLLH